MTTPFKIIVRLTRVRTVFSFLNFLQKLEVSIFGYFAQSRTHVLLALLTYEFHSAVVYESESNFLIISFHYQKI